MTPLETYASLMKTVRERLDVINILRLSQIEAFARAESAAFQGRKIIEAIAFGCLVATENGLSNLPRDAKGQWNAENIFKSLKSKGITALQNPSILRRATPEEQRDSSATIVIDGQPDKCLTYEQLIEIYKSLHYWLHELNPYIHQDKQSFHTERASKLWEDLTRVSSFIEKHFISIHGSAFYCVLRDNQDHLTKVIALNKETA